jgi:DNA-binding response OmpR family regulator
MDKILIVDDNEQITSILATYAEKEKLSPLVAFDGEAALELFKKYSKEIQIILLDVMMPKLDGFSVCKAIRKTSMVPIIMITARGEDFDKIMGLDIGADDYVVKPFSVKEVMARVRAVLRRLNQNGEDARNFTVGSLTINMDDYSVTLDGHDLALTKKEIELLWTFARNKNKVFTRENLLDSIWGYEYSGDSRTVDSHIKRLRAKLDEYSHPEWDIKTIWGVGYRFEESKDAE